MECKWILSKPQPNGDHALRLGSKGRYVHAICSRKLAVLKAKTYQNRRTNKNVKGNENGEPFLRQTAWWLKIKYPTRQYAISPQPVI